MQFINNVMQVINGVVGGMIALFLNMKWWGKMAVILAILAVGSCNPIRQHLAERAAAEQAREQHNMLMAADRNDLAKQPMSLAMDPVSVSEREQARLTGGQFPLLVDAAGQPLVSFVYYPEVNVRAAFAGRLLRPRRITGQLNLVQGVLYHDLGTVADPLGHMEGVDMDRTVGHYGTFRPRDHGMSGPIDWVRVTPNARDLNGMQTETGEIFIATMMYSSKTWRLLPNGDQLVLVVPGGHLEEEEEVEAPAGAGTPVADVATPTMGDDDDGTADDDDDTTADDDVTPTSEGDVSAGADDVTPSPGDDAALPAPTSGDDDDSAPGDDDDSSSLPTGDCVMLDARTDGTPGYIYLWQSSAVGSPRAYFEPEKSRVYTGQPVETLEAEEHGPYVRIRVLRDTYTPAREGWIGGWNVFPCE